MISPGNDDFGLILNCAVRYALGRRTYVPSTVVDFITPLLQHLDKWTLVCFDRDITEHRKSRSLGDPEIDEPVWLQFHAAVTEELNKREGRKG